jgi:hypothetical protein
MGQAKVKESNVMKYCKLQYETLQKVQVALNKRNEKGIKI